MRLLFGSDTLLVLAYLLISLVMFCFFSDKSNKTEMFSFKLNIFIPLIIILNSHSESSKT